jgi:hypothetical protein
MRFTDSYAIQREQPVSMLGLRLDFLTAGCRYDLNRRTALAPLPAGAPGPAGSPPSRKSRSEAVEPVGSMVESRR